MGRNPLVDRRDLEFVLFELLQCESLLKFDRFKDYDLDTFRASLDLAEQLATEMLYEANREGDKNGAVYDLATQSVKVPEAYHKAWKAYVEAGFPGLCGPVEFGGMGMPELIWKGCAEFIMAAAVPLSMYSTLTMGAYQLIYRYGTERDKKLYLEKMISGEWSGTMCLTESEAGSDVGALATKAKRQEDGTYLITGQKIFISSGEHDLCSNIIHAVLARVEGDPPGTKGISIFIVPKFLEGDDGSFSKRNDVVCTGIEHKMGLKGSPTCSLSFGDQGQCVGYLLGKEREGMKIMFDMMNSARLEVAYQGLATSSTAYLHAQTYAKNRLQGYDLEKKVKGSVPIISHPDVARMLLWMKSYCEAMRALTHFAALQYDLLENTEGAAKDEAEKLLDFLIPICKAGNTDQAWLITAEAIQVYGGYGYCQDYPVEQMARDSKIYSLYEGTNGIQSIDLILRKLLLDQDQSRYHAFKNKMHATLAPYKAHLHEGDRARLDKALAAMDETVTELNSRMTTRGLSAVLSEAVPLQKAFKMLCYAWMHTLSLGVILPKLNELIGAKPATKDELEGSEELAYYQGRMRSARYFLQTEFCHYEAYIKQILSNDEQVLSMTPSEFTGGLLV